MSHEWKDVSRRALELSRIDRELLVRELIGSLYEGGEPPLDDGWYEFWIPELRRRMDDYKAGRTKALTWEEVRAGLEAMITSFSERRDGPQLDHS